MLRCILLPRGNYLCRAVNRQHTASFFMVEMEVEEVCSCVIFSKHAAHCADCSHNLENSQPELLPPWKLSVLFVYTSVLSLFPLLFLSFITFALQSSSFLLSYVINLRLFSKSYSFVFIFKAEVFQSWVWKKQKWG